MENELTKDNIKMTEVLDAMGQFTILTQSFNWEYVTKVQILGFNYCLVTFGNEEQYNLYKYINL